MNPDQEERTKARTEFVLQALSKLSKKELLTTENDEELQAVVTSAGFKPVPYQNLIQCKKLILAGMKPQRMSAGQVAKEAAKLPVHLDAVAAMKAGTVPLGSTLLSDKKSRRKRRKKRAPAPSRHRVIAKKPPTMESTMGDLADSVLEVMAGTQCKYFSVEEKEGKYFLTTRYFTESTRQL